MKRLFALAGIGMIAAMCVAVVKRDAGSIASPQSGIARHPMGKFVVHEWGTFTGFAGSDGVHLPFNTLVGSDLPAFVMNRQTFAAQSDPKLKKRLPLLKGGGAAALQRMETPVVYFYADAPGNADVRVDFPQGLLTEFYPPVRKMGPTFGNAFGEFKLTASPTDADSTTSFLDWGMVRIVPHPTGDEGKRIPAVTGKTHYQFARDTDAALVQFTDVAGTRHEEKFLFYRGLGNFTMPVTLTSHGNDHFELKNTSASPITSAILIEIATDDHKTTRFAKFESLAGHQQLTLPLALATQEELSDTITKSLIANGLFEKEAKAMVATWRGNWLDEPGTRILYIVPRPVTDVLLPLQVMPTPDETVRVLVGRIDVMTTEQESRIRSMMQTADTTGVLSSEDVAMLKGLGRFLDPAIDHISKPAGEMGQRQAGRLWEAYSRQTAGHG